MNARDRFFKGETNMKSTFKKGYIRFAVLLTVGIITAIGAAHAGSDGRTIANNWPKWLNWNSSTQPFTPQSASTIQ